MSKKEVRLGVVGLGNMGASHARRVRDGEIRGCRLAAVCDEDAARLDAFADTPAYRQAGRMVKSGDIDALLIATPHFSHVPIGIQALKAGLHVLVEKPIAVHKADAARLLAAHKGRRTVFAAMFNQRTDPRYRRVKDLIERGELGPLVRVNWIITTWLRTNAYYASGGWRATWAGEGGGVLLNQCPHQLDLLQWLCGMPRRVTAFCRLGGRHPIEVEDEVTALLEYPNGASGVFISSTGEAPGTNRLEICGENGRVVVDDDGVRFTRNEIPTLEFIRTSKESFKGPPVWNVEIPTQGRGGQHREILQNFADAIRTGAPLVAPARDGIHSVELGNAMLYAGITGTPVDLPLNGRKYAALLKQLINGER